MIMVQKNVVVSKARLSVDFYRHRTTKPGLFSSEQVSVKGNIRFRILIVAELSLKIITLTWSKLTTFT
jgi:hypothetical protein